MPIRGRKPDPELEKHWPQILAEAMAGVDSVRAIAEKWGISDSYLRKRLKNTEGASSIERLKRREVNSRAALNATKAEILLRGVEVAARAADEDVRDMVSGVEASREILIKIRSMIPDMDQARDLKVAAETVRATIDTIRKIRGLDNPVDSGDDDLGSATEEELRNELARLQGQPFAPGANPARASEKTRAH